MNPSTPPFSRREALQATIASVGLGALAFEPERGQISLIDHLR